MVPSANPESELENVPNPDPSDVLLSVMVGTGVMLQQTPREVILDAASPVIFPPLTAVVDVREDIAAVVNDNNSPLVVMAN